MSNERTYPAALDGVPDKDGVTAHQAWDELFGALEAFEGAYADVLDNQPLGSDGRRLDLRSRTMEKIGYRQEQKENLFSAKRNPDGSLEMGFWRLAGGIARNERMSQEYVGRGPGGLLDLYRIPAGDDRARIVEESRAAQGAVGRLGLNWAAAARNSIRDGLTPGWAVHQVSQSEADEAHHAYAKALSARRSVKDSHRENDAAKALKRSLITGESIVDPVLRRQVVEIAIETTGKRRLPAVLEVVFVGGSPIVVPPRLERRLLDAKSLRREAGSLARHAQHLVWNLGNPGEDVDVPEGRGAKISLDGIILFEETTRDRIDPDTVGERTTAVIGCRRPLIRRRS